MAMASGTDPLDRLQAGARDLRAEREQCHAAADRACRAESGEAFSTVMGKKIDEEAFVIQMEQELAGTLYFDETLLSSLEAAHQDPAMSADDLREAVINLLPLLFSRGAATFAQSSRSRFWHRWQQLTKRKANEGQSRREP